MSTARAEIYRWSGYTPDGHARSIAPAKITYDIKDGNNRDAKECQLAVTDLHYLSYIKNQVVMIYYEAQVVTDPNLNVFNVGLYVKYDQNELPSRQPDIFLGSPIDDNQSRYSVGVPQELFYTKIADDGKQVNVDIPHRGKVYALAFFADILPENSLEMVRFWQSNDGNNFPVEVIFADKYIKEDILGANAQKLTILPESDSPIFYQMKACPNLR